jgi:hypothetical protein
MPYPSTDHTGPKVYYVQVTVPFNSMGRPNIPCLVVDFSLFDPSKRDTIFKTGAEWEITGPAIIETRYPRPNVTCLFLPIHVLTYFSPSLVQE